MEHLVLLMDKSNQTKLEKILAMKKLFVFLFLSLFLSSSSLLFSQNLQVHYDMGKDRGYLTTTLEMFKPDKYGNTFFFVDFDHSTGNVKGVSLAYMEIARVFKTEKMPFGIQFEYNGGFGQFKAGDVNNAFRLNDAWLGGIDYSINARDFSKGISFKALFKHIRAKHDVSFQFTTVWYVDFANNKMTFAGFLDFWKEDFDFDFDGTVDSKYVLLAEPQLMYNVCEHISFGTEIEISNNFGMKGFNIMPTLFAKWTF